MTKCKEFAAVLRNELRFIFSDGGAILVIILAIFIYGIIFSWTYSSEVARDIPVAVIDQSHTPSSRLLIKTFDSSANVNVAYVVGDMEQAKDLFFKREVYGIVYIPADYEPNLTGGGRNVVGVYTDGSYFLMYRQVFSDIVNGLTGTGAEVEVMRLISQGASGKQAESIANPVAYKQTNLYNPYTGYGTFLMPAILIVIIQQTLLIGIGLVGGTWREKRLYNTLVSPGAKRLSTLPLVLGKSTAYLLINFVTVTLALGVVYKAFDYPMRGDYATILIFLVPYVLSCIFLGIFISTLFRFRENSLLLMFWTSIPLLLLTGASLPRQAIPDWMYTLGKIFPSGSGVDGFVRIQLMGAQLSEVISQYRTLWILTLVYLILACIGVRFVLSRKCKNDCDCQP